MVKLEEITDDKDYITDDSASDVSETETKLVPYSVDDETLLDRIYALRDIVSPETQLLLSTFAKDTVSGVRTVRNILGAASWVVITSSLVVGLPLALAIEGESALVQQEREMGLNGQNAGAMLPSSVPPELMPSGQSPVTVGGLPHSGQQVPAGF